MQVWRRRRRRVENEVRYQTRRKYSGVAEARCQHGSVAIVGKKRGRNAAAVCRKERRHLSRFTVIASPVSRLLRYSHPVVPPIHAYLCQLGKALTLHTIHMSGSYLHG
jgi:hypothetical protein